jgi:small nuclear ribonucleoprotein (snRNP)-like protein
MNLTLGDAEEIEFSPEGTELIKAKYGEILLRGNNILWIRIPE